MKYDLVVCIKTYRVKFTYVTFLTITNSFFIKVKSFISAY